MRGAVAALGLVLAGWPLAAAGQTVIAPDVAADRALGTTVGRMGPVFTIGGGTRVGGNLFHSFARFDLAGGDVARWVRPGDAATIANVINRVTGGQASHISGTIDSTALPNATFYFINPAGIVFGPGAQVNVPAAAHFSTAAELRLADGNRFAVATPGGSTLSVAPPEAWGFLGGQGAIDIQGVDLNPEQTTLHFTGAHVSVNDSRFVTRGFDLIAVGDGPATVRLSDPLAANGDGRIQVGGSQLSAIELTFGGRSVRVGGGVIDIQASSLTSNGNLFVTATERLETSGAAFVVSSVTRDAAGVIALRAPEIVLDDTRVRADAIGDGAPGRILIEGDRLAFHRAEIQGDARDGEGALPGLIQLRATGDLLLLDSFVRSNAAGVAAGGIVSLEGRQVLLDGSRVESDSLQFGDAGRVMVKTDTLRLTAASQITSTTNGLGVGGDVLIDAGGLNLDLASSIRSDAAGSGQAGKVTITAQTMDLSDNSVVSSRAASGTGDAGEVHVTVGRLTLTDSRINSGTFSLGRGGLVDVRADEIVLNGGGSNFVTGITSESLGPGAAGQVFIDARTLTVRDLAYVSSDTRSNGNAGPVQVRADEVTLINGGKISSDTFGGGAAGEVTVTAGKLVIRGGDLGITSISSDSFGFGDAGPVVVDAGSILVEQGGFISSDTFMGADAGQIAIQADSITLQGGGGVSSRTFTEGHAGTIDILTKSLVVSGGSAVSSEATDRSRGDAGDITITADTIAVGLNGRITTSSRGPGAAGGVVIDTGALTLTGGIISSSADIGSTGASGSVDVTAETLLVQNGGAISTLSTNPNRAGLVTLAAGTLRVDGSRSLISSENQAGNPNFGGQGGLPGPGGDAGTILIGADNLTLSNGGRITTNAFAGAAGDIEITIERPGLLILEGAESSGVIQTSSGPGTGGKITIRDPLAIISNGGAILALGQQRGANVLIQSRYFINSTDRLNVVDVDGDFQLQTGLYDVSSGTVSRDLSVLDASKVLRGQCPAARSTGAVSQLITRPVGPYAREGAIDVLGRAAPGGGCP